MPLNSVSLPPELYLLVLSYLPEIDVRSFSLCSKACRDLTIPYLFRSLKLCEASLAAFQAGGSFHSLRFKVRHVTFRSLGFSDVLKTISLARQYCENLYLFPELIGLRIQFLAIIELRSLLPIMILRMISTCAFYKNIKSLSLECTRLPRSDWIPPSSDTTPIWSRKDGGLITQAMGLTLEELQSTKLSYPPALEHAVLQDVVYFDFQKDSKGLDNPYLFFTLSSSTLKTLKITAPGIALHLRPASPQRPVFPNVEDLVIRLETGFGEWHLADLATGFPNLQTFKIDTSHSTDITWDVYAGEWKFKKLKRARLVWPVHVWIPSYDKRVDLENLGQMVRNWTSSELQEVEFVKRKKSYIGTVYDGCRFERIGEGCWEGESYEGQSSDLGYD
ncbi:hypothetical protein H072_7109 [Dactylellina haptotyla CBS 200.50]|uniref:F-box domain-containing protein n=1 Tax=Dactylellina haptotyla (strain CBS 200.50) TaxID=1284197 RepID=S8BIH8_DACHA|nr:hypothetical protein H072_7109 [Dactylellina haptotyla CBS 200.50]